MKNMALNDLPDYLRETNGAYIKDITSVNCKPHPYMVGGKHISYAADNCGGILGEEVVRNVPCAQSQCNLSYDEHTYDLVAFVKLTADIRTEDLQAWLIKITDFVKAADRRLDGFAFIESPPFKILPREEK